MFFAVWGNASARGIHTPPRGDGDDDGVCYHHMNHAFVYGCGSLRLNPATTTTTTATRARRVRRTCVNMPSKMTTPSVHSSCCRASSSKAGLAEGFDELLNRVQDYSYRFPDVEGMDRLLKAITREKEVALNLILLRSSPPQEGEVEDDVHQPPLFFGVDNNFRPGECLVHSPISSAVHPRESWLLKH